MFIPIKNTEICASFHPKKVKKRVLFLLKKRHPYHDRGHKHHNNVSYGLINSCKFVAQALVERGVESYIATVIDGNDIDRVVNRLKPDICFIEALWVTPEKIKEILPLHPKTHFNVRLHSNMPFLVQDGIAIEWLKKYKEIISHQFGVSGNCKKLIDEVRGALNFNLEYTPNCYPIDESLKPNTKAIGDILDVGCFGAVRLLKNTAEQAIAAISVAKDLNKKLNFHINSSIYEQAAQGVLKNLRNLFAGTRNTLVEHDWSTHEDFLKLVNKMDVGMQVSISETFNIVAADFATQGVPIVGSKEIEFLAFFYQANPTDVEDIKSKLKLAISLKPFGAHAINEVLLRRQSKKAIEVWTEYLGI